MKKIHDHIVLELQNFFLKTKYGKAVVGISGGLDSAVVAALAVEALGRDGVHGLFMPSQYTTRESTECMHQLAESLNIHVTTIPITPLYCSYTLVLRPILDHPISGTITGENLQARIRGNLLMLYANAYNHLVLATGNKSEALCGYCTLYGDTVGAIAPIGGLLKTDVYKLAEYLGTIPISIITRAPTAELSHNQKDEDELLPYHMLDQILYRYLQGMSPDTIIAEGFIEANVNKIFSRIDSNKFKAKQCSPVIEIPVRF
jgi:NAD+ synthase (glutamine-hydrolysing)